MKWLTLLAGVLANASASVLIKIAMLPPHRFPSLTRPLQLFTNWPLMLGMVLYATTLGLYAIALNSLPLNVAHPILTAGAVATVAVFSYAVLHEPFPWTTAVGSALVAAGVGLISLSAA